MWLIVQRSTIRAYLDWFSLIVFRKLLGSKFPALLTALTLRNCLTRRPKAFVGSSYCLVYFDCIYLVYLIKIKFV